MKGNFNHSATFKLKFENKCIWLMVAAYKQSLSDKTIQLNWNENDITSQLVECIDKNPFRLKTPYIASNVEQHLPNTSGIREKGFADKQTRIDLRFVTFRSNQEHKVFFEAKNLKENDSALKRRYINTGIENYTSGKYPNGFLVGYLLEGIVSSTIDGINNLLEKDNRKEEWLLPQNHTIVNHYYESEHPSCCIKHLIFDFQHEINI